MPSNKHFPIEVGIARVMADVSIDDNGCWLWTKSVTKRGYPQMSFNGKKVYPHRWLYEVTVAPQRRDGG